MKGGATVSCNLPASTFTTMKNLFNFHKEVSRHGSDSGRCTSDYHDPMACITPIWTSDDGSEEPLIHPDYEYTRSSDCLKSLDTSPI